MIDVYDICPRYEGKKYTLRFVEKNDCGDLLKVYFDEKAVPFFNSDNCYGDDFHYTAKEQMARAIDFWIDKYNSKDFVRWSIIDNTENEAIGTIELFHRDSNDVFTDCGLLRLDLRSDYEKSAEIVQILQLITEPAFSLFDCNKIATKAIPEAEERISALRSLGFNLSHEKLIGHDGTEYGDYFVYKKSVPVWENPPSLTKREEEYFYDFIEKDLRFYPSSYDNAPFLPFSLNRPFAVYDISKMTDEQIVLLYDIVPKAFINCLQDGHHIYFCDWNHNLFIYDPRNPENCRGDQGELIYFTDDGIVSFGSLIPDGDYYFYIEQYGEFGYLSHPWREEVWVFGEKLLKEFEHNYKKIGFIPKTILK